MPTKKNFLGGQQNYNAKTGEYESSLVGANGKVVKDADGDGVSHEASKQEPKKPSVYSESKVFSNLKEGEKYNFSDGGYYSSEDVDNSLKFLKSSLSEEQWNAIKDNKDYMEGYLKGKYNVGGLKMAADIELEEGKNNSFEEISEGLADYQWMITDKTTVGQYAEEVGSKLGKSKEQVLSVIRNENADIKETDKMSVVAGLEEEQDFNDPNERESMKAEEKEFSDSKKDTEKNGYPKGTSKEYTDEVNKKYSGAVDTLKKAGIKTDYKNFEEISKAQKDIMNKWEQSKDDAKYKPLYEALEIVEDKMYNDDYIRLAPYGY